MGVANLVVSQCGARDPPHTNVSDLYSVVYDVDNMDYDETQTLLFKNINLRWTDQILDMVLELTFPEPLDHPSDFFEMISEINLMNEGNTMINIPGPLLKTLIRLKFPMALDAMTPSQILRIPLPLDLDQPAFDDKNLTVLSNWCSHMLAGYHNDFRLEIRLKPLQDWSTALAKFNYWQLNLMRHRFHNYLIDKIKPYLSGSPFVAVNLNIKHAIHSGNKRDKLRQINKVHYFKINKFIENRFKLTHGRYRGRIDVGGNGFDRSLHSIMVIIKPDTDQKYHYNDLESIIIYGNGRPLHRLTPTICWMTLLKYAPHYLKNDLTEPIYLLLLPDEEMNLHRLSWFECEVKSRSSVSGEVYLFFNDIATRQIMNGCFLQ